MTWTTSNVEVVPREPIGVHDRSINQPRVILVTVTYPRRHPLHVDMMIGPTQGRSVIDTLFYISAIRYIYKMEPSVSRRHLPTARAKLSKICLVGMSIVLQPVALLRTTPLLPVWFPSQTGLHKAYRVFSRQPLRRPRTFLALVATACCTECTHLRVVPHRVSRLTPEYALRYQVRQCPQNARRNALDQKWLLLQSLTVRFQQSSRSPPFRRSGSSINVFTRPVRFVNTMLFRGRSTNYVSGA